MALLVCRYKGTFYIIRYAAYATLK